MAGIWAKSPTNKIGKIFSIMPGQKNAVLPPKKLVSHSWKSVFIERIRDFTNLRIKITATSRLAGMSMGGSTVD